MKSKKLKQYLILVAASVGMFLGAALVPKTKIVSMTMDMPTSEDLMAQPESFLAALREAAEEYQVDYEVLLCLRLAEMGRARHEMGINGINPGVTERHPNHTQAYWAGRLVAMRQKEYCASKSLQLRYAKRRYPFLAYLAVKWCPKNKGYYWDSDRQHGIGYYYERYSVGGLEAAIGKAEKGRVTVNY